MTPAGLPPWPAAPVAHGPVVLRQFTADDVPMAQELATDPYVPLVGSLPANASREQARDWVDRQRGRWRAHRCPHWWQVMLVLTGFTRTTRRPALSALLARMLLNWYQPASRMLLFSPALAAAWFGRNPPGLSGSGFGPGRRVIPAAF